MKKTILLTLAALALLAAAAAVSAQSGLYPIGGQPSYPVPNYNPGNQYQQQYYNNQQQNQQPQTNCQPYYDPYSNRWIQPVCPTETPVPQWYYPQQYYPYNPQPYNPQPYNPAPYNPQPYNPAPYNPQPYNPYPSQQGNVKVSKQWRSNGTIDLTWEIRNTTGENWPRANIDIKCLSGCYLLTNPNRTLWDIPYTVNRNETLTFTVNITQQSWYDTMTFAMVAGSKTLYTFTVTP